MKIEAPTRAQRRDGGARDDHVLTKGIYLPPRTGAFLITPLEGDSHGMRTPLITVSITAVLIKISSEHEYMARMNSGTFSASIRHPSTGGLVINLVWHSPCRRWIASLHGADR